MVWREPFSLAERIYIYQHRDEWPSVIAYKISELFGTQRTARGVRGVLKQGLGSQENKTCKEEVMKDGIS
jgi:hypothetical protein